MDRLIGWIAAGVVSLKILLYREKGCVNRIKLNKGQLKWKKN